MLSYYLPAGLGSALSGCSFHWEMGAEQAELLAICVCAGERQKLLQAVELWNTNADEPLG